MGQHRTPDSLQLLEALGVLGRALGYATDDEISLADAGGEGQAIDHAWYAPGHDSAPLFVFEVETNSSRAMGANVTKVLTKPTERLLKPLFFFQLLLRGGGSSPSSTDLRSAYGHLNYRLVDLAVDGPASFIDDVLLQHRRLTSVVNVADVLAAAGTEPFNALRPALTACVNLGFAGTYRAGIGEAALHHPDARSALLEYLDANPASYDKYGELVADDWWPSYLGRLLFDRLEPLLVAALDPTRSPAAASALASAPLEELDQQNTDWDYLLLEVIPALWVLAACCVRGDAENEATRRLRHYADRFRNWTWGYPGFIWMAHFAAAREDAELYELAADRIRELGGVDWDTVSTPMLFFGLEDDSWILEMQVGQPIELGSCEAFRQAMADRLHGEPPDPAAVVLRLLLGDDWLGVEGGRDLISLLYQSEWP